MHIYGFMVFDVKYVHGSTKSNLNNQHNTNELWHFFYFTYLRFLTFFPSFRLVTMAMTNTFSCHTICQKSPTVLGFGPVIIMFRHFILIHIHFCLTLNISDLRHIYWFQLTLRCNVSYIVVSILKQ